MIMINRFSEKNVTDRVMFSQRNLSGGGSLSQHAAQVTWLGGLVRETPRTVTSGRYTSYWNAFLLQLILIEIRSRNFNR